MTHAPISSNTLTRVLCCILAFFTTALFFAPNAEAKPGDFELGLSAGYNYAMALNPVDGNAKPKAIVDGHGFAATISAGARVNQYVGVYADFGLNLSFAANDKDFVTTTIEEKDHFYAFTALVAVRFFQAVYKGEFVETFAMGYDYAGDKFRGEDPGSGFAVKVGFAYLHNITEHFEIGLSADVISTHKFERDYFNFSVAGSVLTVYHF